MSKKSNKGNNVIFDNMIVHYDPVDDVFNITSKDADLQGKPFNITLNNASSSEETLRKVFTEKGIIQESNYSDLAALKKYEYSDNPRIIPLGTGYHEKIWWNIDKIPHMIIAGPVGSGSSVILRNIILHCKKHADDIDVSLFGDARELSSYTTNDNITTVTSAEKILEEMIQLKIAMDNRYRMLENENKNYYKDVSQKINPKIVILYDYKYIVNCITNDNDKLLFTHLLEQIICIGRAAGINVVFIDSKFSNKLLDNEKIFSNFLGRIILGNVNSEMSRKALSNDRAAKNSGLPRGLGYSNFTIDKLKIHNPVVFSMYHTTENDLF